MKKSLLYLFMLACSVNLFTSCSDDDDVVYPIDTEIAGVYKGTLDISLAENPIGSGIPKNITISKAGDASVNMELKDFSFMGMDLGTITLSNCVLTKEGNNYKFTGKQALNVEKYLLTGDIDAQGTISGNAVVVNLDIAAKLGGLEQAVKVVYRGSKLSGSESGEAKIVNFTFSDEFVTEQPVVNDADATITFKVDYAATNAMLSAMTPTIAISEKATITPASGVKQDFSDGKAVVYTVVAEDGTAKKYTVSIAGTVLMSNFDSWVEQKSEDGASFGFYTPAGGYWDTSNTGVYLIKSMLSSTYPDLAEAPFAVENASDAHLGTGAAKVSTIDSKGAYGLIPKITAGTLFLGYFNVDYAFDNALKCTRFGLVWKEKPLKVTGFYKYIPGSTYYRCDNPATARDIAVEDNTKKDACMISAVLYEIPSEDDKDCLDGSNIYTSTDRITAIAQFSTDQKVDKYSPFTLELNYIKSYDSSKKYRFAVIASSSKDGDKFSGSPTSALYLDDIEIINE